LRRGYLFFAVSMAAFNWLWAGRPTKPCTILPDLSSTIVVGVDWMSYWSAVAKSLEMSTSLTSIPPTCDCSAFTRRFAGGQVAQPGCVKTRTTGFADDGAVEDVALVIGAVELARGVAEVEQPARAVMAASRDAIIIIHAPRLIPIIILS
jgi:hypothetical protein